MTEYLVAIQAARQLAAHVADGGPKPTLLVCREMSDPMGLFALDRISFPIIR